MKNGKNRNRNFYDDEVDEYDRPAKKKDSHRRRPIKNWKNAWRDHYDEAVEFDEFFSK